MGIIQEWIERDKKISEAFQACMTPENLESMVKAQEYLNRMASERIESQCPLCRSCDSPKIRICEEHQILLTNN